MSYNEHEQSFNQELFLVPPHRKMKFCSRSLLISVEGGYDIISPSFPIEIHFARKEYWFSARLPQSRTITFGRQVVTYRSNLIYALPWPFLLSWYFEHLTHKFTERNGFRSEVPNQMFSKLNHAWSEILARCSWNPPNCRPSQTMLQTLSVSKTVKRNVISTCNLRFCLISNYCNL